MYHVWLQIYAYPRRRGYHGIFLEMGYTLIRENFNQIWSVEGGKMSFQAESHNYKFRKLWEFKYYK